MVSVSDSNSVLEAISNAATPAEVVMLFTTYCTDIGFRTVNIGQLSASADPKAKKLQFSNMPKDYIQYRIAQNTSLHDPTLIMARQTMLPFTWEKAYAHADRLGRMIIDECRSYTESDGLFFPIHSHDFISGFISLGADHIPDDPRIRNFLSFAASAAYMRLNDLMGPYPRQEEVNLSARERDVIYAASQGLTNKEAARLLKIAPDTVKQYMSSAQRKLGASDRAMAVAKAISKGQLPY
ncbi:MAG: autoinducer binding domain-containing protein [Pseudomonadota bacterium]